MEKELTEGELLNIIKSLPNNKTPGEDGLPAEFYKVFWLDIKSLLLNSYNYSFEQGSLSITQRRGVLCLIPKKTNPLKLKNWRPISLLNQDYKILSKLVAERIKPCLHELIDPDQSGFLKGRYIGQNIISILDILHYTENEQIPGGLISIDFEKAFDKLEWSFIRKCLEFFHFPDNIKKWINIIYENIQSCVSNNGWQSDYFTLQRGVRQGCPLSPYLFILCAEVLAKSMRDNEEIKGFNIGTKKFKIKQYADDTQIFSQFNGVSLNAIIETFDNFANASGLLINYDKTEVLRIGSLKNTFDQLTTEPELKWTSGPLTVLGIKISAELTAISERNLEPIIEKIEYIVKIWSQRKLTLIGKVTIIKSLLESQLIYRLSVLPSPPIEYLKRIDKILFSFLWNNKPHKICKDIITQSKEQAGLSMTDIYLKNRALKIAWISRLLTDIDGNIYPLLQKYCKVPIKYLLECNLSPQDVNHCWLKKPSEFWADVIYQWCHYNYTSTLEVKSPWDQTILLNSNIKVNNQVIFIKELQNKNILYIRNLVNEQGVFYSYEDFQAKYNTRLTFIHYYGMINAIPATFKNALTVNMTPSINLNLVRITKKTGVSKIIYTDLVNKKQAFPEKSYQKIKVQFNIEITKDDFLIRFQNIYKITLSSKLREFQYRLLNSALVTNKDLYKWGLKNHDRCSFCNLETETAVHLLVKCQVSKGIWDYVHGTMRVLTNLFIQMSDSELFLGTINTEGHILTNLISIIIKQYLYAFRCFSTMPSPGVIIEKKEIRHIESCAAFKNNQTEKFNQKWGPLQGL